MEEDDIMINDEILDDDQEVSEGASSGKYDKLLGSDSHKFKLSGMFKDWFLDYASYVILQRAVPHIVDGLKPVQRRVLHAMYRMDDGNFTKVANIVGQAMQYHPHGDASILGALVQLGQKGFAIDCQGNWGNILTGDSNAAPRYIEARLSKFAKEVIFDPKVTNGGLPTTDATRSPWSSLCVSPSSWRRAPRVSPSAWRPRSCRTTSMS